ncbi:hypothetical protein ACS0TY_020742 [Phlomoides rotata]
MDVIDALDSGAPSKSTIYGSKLPLSWMVSPLNQLRSFKSFGCNHLSSLPPLGKLPCLEDITPSVSHLMKYFLKWK